MPGDPNKLSHFWQELKRRKVVRVITIYAAVAFVILQLVEILAPSLRLPEWTMNFILVLLIVGFIITVIVSWIYDVHPEGGIVKTEPAQKAKSEEIPPSTNSWRIATYISGVVIVGLLVLNIFGGEKRVKIDESIEKSIAVLPFHNYSGDSNQDFICSGLTDEIISHLYKIASFDEVRSLTSVLKYKDSDKSTSEIAEDLKVNYILEGSYKRIGDELRVTAQLIEPKSDKHIWLQDYDLPYKDIISIPAEIAFQIANHLKAFITAAEQQRIERIPTINEHAFEIIQKLKYYYIRRDLSFQYEDSLLKAIELDPEYADPYALMGYVGLMDLTYSADPTRNTQTTVYDILPYLDHALELDPERAYAHWVRGHYNRFVTWNYAEALRNYKKAIDIEPNNVIFCGSYSIMLMQVGQREEFMGQFFTPDGIRLHVKYDSLEEYEKFKEEYLNRIGENGLTIIGENYLWLKEYDSARNYLETAVHLGNLEMTTSRYLACLALAYQKTDEPDKASEIVKEIITRSYNSFPGSPEFYIGWYYSGIGKVDSAFHWLGKAYNRHSSEMSWLKADPVLENIRDDDRYRDLYERTGHKAYDDYIVNKKQ